MGWNAVAILVGGAAADATGVVADGRDDQGLTANVDVHAGTHRQPAAVAKGVDEPIRRAGDFHQGGDGRRGRADLGRGREVAQAACGEVVKADDERLTRREGLHAAVIAQALESARVVFGSDDHPPPFVAVREGAVLLEEGHAVVERDLPEAFGRREIRIGARHQVPEGHCAYMCDGQHGRGVAAAIVGQQLQRRRAAQAHQRPIVACVKRAEQGGLVVGHPITRGIDDGLGGLQRRRVPARGRKVDQSGQVDEPGASFATGARIGWRQHRCRLQSLRRIGAAFQRLDEGSRRDCRLYQRAVLCGGSVLAPDHAVIDAHRVFALDQQRTPVREHEFDAHVARGSQGLAVSKPIADGQQAPSSFGVDGHGRTVSDDLGDDGTWAHAGLRGLGRSPSAREASVPAQARGRNALGASSTR